MEAKEHSIPRKTLFTIDIDPKLNHPLNMKSPENIEYTIELEDEGFVKRQAGVGTFVSSGNLDLIKDAKYRTVEEQLKGVVTEAKMLNISIEDLRAMLDILYEDDVYDK